ncbi:hypothetical protein [Methyloradius palustris]|uniref:Transmembrane protein n=1 Tax=Methyloradius palustris TaxID=2778876 RepID=A0A8D5GDH9_9PROT|nr:hypothetical protein [Methyloradius palustris]BCM24624.1 hypothetical protein ZMTM_08830 [Methyloradius palustris]
MALSKTSSAESLGHQPVLPETYTDYIHANASVVSWAAILAGATSAAAFSLILLVLGAGLGLSSISPWAHEGVSATAFGVSTIVWVAVTQILASGLGGYLAGRLRTKWTGTHVDEVYFRDTAHGFLTWAVATLATAALLSSVIGSVVGGTAKAGASLAGGVATAVVSSGVTSAGVEMGRHHDSSGLEGGPIAYLVDSLFRPDPNATTDTSQSSVPLPEVTRIFINSANAETLPPVDASYLGQLVAKHTGLSQQDAERRVNDTFASLQAKKHEAEAMAKDAAEKARKATIYATLWLFVSFLMGAFSASLAATCGGRSRDV